MLLFCYISVVTYVSSVQKNRIIETTHNICFGGGLDKETCWG